MSTVRVHGTEPLDRADATERTPAAPTRTVLDGQTDSPALELVIDRLALLQDAQRLQRRAAS